MNNDLPATGGRRRPDPVRLEVLKNRLASIAEEMGAVLMRSSSSANIKERRDFSCALFDGQGQMIAQAAHIPVHLGSMPLSVKAVLERPDLERGDMVLLNDPFRGGTHLPDLTLVAPVFAGSATPRFFLANRAHHADVGGMAPGSLPLSTEIFQEGLRIPPVKLVRAERLDPDIVQILLANVRTPREREGDLYAQVAANHAGEQRLLELLDHHGIDEVTCYSEALLDYGARMMEAVIAGIPDGTFRFEDVMDGDGIAARNLPIRCTLTVKGARAVVDFRETAPQARGCVNAVRAITLSAVLYTFRLLAADALPANAGCLRPIDVLTRPGTLVDAQFPAAVAAGNVETSQRIVDVLLGALAQALPDRIPAASAGTMSNVTIGGMDSRTGEPFAYYETIAGGSGAGPRGDGASGMHTHMTNTLNTPVEALEQAFPLRILEYAIRPNSGGAGRHRGGDGVVKVIELLEDASVTVLAERHEQPPYGLRDGQPGTCGAHRWIRDGQTQPLPGKCAVAGKAGDRIVVETPGGGGWGAPET